MSASTMTVSGTRSSNGVTRHCRARRTGDELGGLKHADPDHNRDCSGGKNGRRASDAEGGGHGLIDQLWLYILPMREVIVLLYHRRSSRTAVAASSRSPLLDAAGGIPMCRNRNSLWIACLP
jgi:hypothetical protein